MTSRLDNDSEAFIDALRGLAALAVLVSHSVDFGVRGVFGQDLHDAPGIWRWAAASIGHGSFWVWCFFVVSGLCIHRSIGRSMESRTFSWRRYAAARITRIYPLFLLGLLLAVITWWVTDEGGGKSEPKPWPQFFSSLLSLQIFTSTFPNFMPSWSLSNEMLYYAAWPMALLAVRRQAASAFFLAVVASFALCFSIGFLWLGLQRLETSTAVHGLWSVGVLFPLWLGGAWLGENWEDLSSRVGRRLWLGSFFLCLVAEVVLASVKYHNAPQSIIDFTALISLPGIVLMLAGARHARLGSFSGAQPCVRWLGSFSYPCYVLHMPLMVVIMRLVIPRMPDGFTTHPLLRSLALLLPVLLVLALVGPCLERRIMAWRSTFLSRVKP